ncbi:MAG: tRNA pseudouridine(55) synthase TruB [Mariprofundaceae bacterium]|nr:tRNA pseudouridine(55) synthase TruB [Mariprofundaceae bacterium]
MSESHSSSELNNQEAACGIVFLDKPHGWTSRKAVNEISRLFPSVGKKRAKAGHAGTLDPLATGMLPILIGEATRFSGIGLDADKTYRVTLDMSLQTDTLDGEGEVISRFDALPDLAAIEAVLPRFNGDIEQQPPAYSAIHVNGKRAHEIMRQGGEVELATRRVTIYELQLVNFESPLLSLRVRCSKGTYIRSLARDIGAALQAGGCVCELRRLSTAGWPEVVMADFEQLQADPYACLLPLAQWLRHLPSLALSQENARRFAHGQRIQLDQSADSDAEGEVAVFYVVGNAAVTENSMFLGTASIKPGMHRMVLHPLRVLPSSLQRLDALDTS